MSEGDVRDGSGVEGDSSGGREGGRVRIPSRHTSLKEATSKFRSLEDQALARDLSTEYWHEKKSFNQKSYRLNLEDRKIALEAQKREQERTLAELEARERAADESLRLFLEQEESDRKVARQHELESAQHDAHMALTLHKEEIDRQREELEQMQKEEAALLASDGEVALRLHHEEVAMESFDEDAKLAKSLHEEEHRREKQLRKTLSQDEALARQLSVDDGTHPTSFDGISSSEEGLKASKGNGTSSSVSTSTSTLKSDEELARSLQEMEVHGIDLSHNLRMADTKMAELLRSDDQRDSDAVARIHRTRVGEDDDEVMGFGDEFDTPDHGKLDGDEGGDKLEQLMQSKEFLEEQRKLLARLERQQQDERLAAALQEREETRARQAEKEGKGKGQGQGQGQGVKPHHRSSNSNLSSRQHSGLGRQQRSAQAQENKRRSVDSLTGAERDPHTGKYKGSSRKHSVGSTGSSHRENRVSSGGDEIDFDEDDDSRIEEFEV